MKIKVLSPIAVLGLMASFGFASETHQTSITGYATGEFAVKGPIERQLERQVIVPLSTEASKATGGKIEIRVTGYADQTGTGATNDRLAKSRAEEVAAVLGDKFPKAKIVALSKGDEKNSRMVTVAWKVTVAPTQPKPSHGDGLMAGIIAGLIMAVLLVMLFRRKHTANGFAPRYKENLAPEPAPTTITIGNWTEWVEVAMEDGTYTVLITQETDEEGELWRTPFRTQSNPDAFIIRRKRRDAIAAVKSCMRNQFYQPAIEDLIAAGKIKKGV